MLWQIAGGERATKLNMETANNGLRLGFKNADESAYFNEISTEGREGRNNI